MSDAENRRNKRHTTINLMKKKKPRKKTYMNKNATNTNYGREKERKKESFFELIRIPAVSLYHIFTNCLVISVTSLSYDN